MRHDPLDPRPNGEIPQPMPVPVRLAPHELGDVAEPLEAKPGVPGAVSTWLKDPLIVSTSCFVPGADGHRAGGGDGYHNPVTAGRVKSRRRVR